MSGTITVEREHQPAAARRLMLGLLFVVALFNYGDRYMLAILIPDIKAELGLSDSQIGFLTGIAFTIFYATLGIPIAPGGSPFPPQDHRRGTSRVEHHDRGLRPGADVHAAHRSPCSGGRG